MIKSLPTLSATQALGQGLASLLDAGDVLALRGGLGAGKTSFARALIGCLLNTPVEVPSPTFTLVQTYEARDFPIYHFDLYRVETPEDIFELGWDDTVDGVSLIEWPDKAGAYLPKWRLDLWFEQTEGSHSVRLEPHGEHWQARLHEL